MRISFDKSITQDVAEATRREWLETNGLGGWASSTLCGANTRRYHGLLIAATRPPAGRLVLISKLDETLVINGQRFELGCNFYPGGVIHPRGFQYLSRFQRGIFPQFDYLAGGVHLRKTIAAIQGENTTVVSYQVLKAPDTFILELQPFLAMRDIHSLTHANDHLQTKGTFKQGVFRIQPYPNLPEVFLSVPGAVFQSQPDWYYRFEYPVERYRGLDFQEDLFTPGTFSRKLKNGERFSIILSTENPRGRHAFQLVDKERRRRQSLTRKLAVKTDFTRTLALAADQFIVQRGDGLRTIIAGYHWFTDWGRDTMISLPGLCLATGRYEDAKKILATFARHTSRGMLPNRFPESGETPEYNTVDASLWFFVAVYRYWQSTGDEKFLRKTLIPVLREILEWHQHGTRFGIHVDSDGLLSAGEPGVQLTWMDAKVGDWVVTPRQGKAVEINALWYNALKIFAEFCDKFGDATDAARYAKKAAAVRKRFNELFWNEAQSCLLDYIDGEHRDATIRPNQVFALSLPFPLLNKKRARVVLQAVEEHLLTPRGLRSLSPNNPDYYPVYGGDLFARDSAYHQGTVWGWLMGPYMTALVRVRGIAGKKQAKQLLQGMEEHLTEAGVGTISEIFDGDPPHTPRGCIAQAWSVAELLRACTEDVEPAASRSDR